MTTTWVSIVLTIGKADIGDIEDPCNDYDPRPVSEGSLHDILYMKIEHKKQREGLNVANARRSG